MKIISILYFLTSSYIFAQVGEIIWVENFNNLENWMKITGNGSWGWGNGELEYYQEDNVDIAELDIYCNNCLTATYNTTRYSASSGKFAITLTSLTSTVGYVI